MEKEFVTYEQSLALKELGFDEPCFGYYVNGEIRGVNLGIEELGGVEPYYQKFGFHMLNNHHIDNTSKIVVSAPTFSQAFRWFRNTYKLHVSFTQWCGERFYFNITDMVHPRRFDEYSVENLRNICEEKSQEEIELKALDKLIELVKNNDNN